MIDERTLKNAEKAIYTLTYNFTVDSASNSLKTTSFDKGILEKDPGFIVSDQDVAIADKLMRKIDSTFDSLRSYILYPAVYPNSTIQSEKNKIFAEIKDEKILKLLAEVNIRYIEPNKEFMKQLSEFIKLHKMTPTQISTYTAGYFINHMQETVPTPPSIYIQKIGSNESLYSGNGPCPSFFTDNGLGIDIVPGSHNSQDSYYRIFLKDMQTFNNAYVNLKSAQPAPAPKPLTLEQIIRQLMSQVKELQTFQEEAESKFDDNEETISSLQSEVKKLSNENINIKRELQALKSLLTSSVKSENLVINSAVAKGDDNNNDDSNNNNNFTKKQRM